MDLNEHTLNEAQRTLKRLGVTHVLRSRLKTEAPAEPQPSLCQTSNTDQAAIQGTDRPHEQTLPETPQPLLLRSLFHGKQIPARTLWTYAGLYRDLQETDNPPRLNVFKKIQESVSLHLKWSAATLCSWPLDIDPASFTKGIAHFSPQTVIIFIGNENDIDAGVKKNLVLLEQGGQRVIVLPNLDKMAQGNQQLKNEAWKILQSIQG